MHEKTKDYPLFIKLSFFFVIYIVLMVIFTFFDYETTNRLFNPGTTFGKIFEVLGPSPMPFFVIYSGISLFFIPFTKRITRFFSFSGLSLALIYTSFMGVMTFKHSYAEWMFIPSIIMYALLIAFSIILNIKINDVGKDVKKKHIMICLCIFIVSFSSIFCSDLIKSIFGRVRYINLDNIEQYYPWYHINKFDFNSSFPSGHASRSLTLICASFILFYFNQEKWAFIIEIVSVLFAITVSISRLFEGMHYPTDVITGLFITIVPYIICKYRLIIAIKKPPIIDDLIH